MLSKYIIDPIIVLLPMKSSRATEADGENCFKTSSTTCCLYIFVESIQYEALSTDEPSLLVYHTIFSVNKSIFPYSADIMKLQFLVLAIASLASNKASAIVTLQLQTNVFVNCK